MRITGNYAGMERPCSQCKELIIVTEKQVKNKSYVCHPCQSNNAVQWAKRNPKQKQLGNRAYLRTEKGKLAIRRKIKRFREAHPDRATAYQAVQTATRNGSLIRESCVCGNTKVHAHHKDYSKPLEVEWLCQPCHSNKHLAMIEARKEEE